MTIKPDNGNHTVTIEMSVAEARLLACILSDGIGVTPYIARNHFAEVHSEKLFAITEAFEEETVAA